MRHALHDKNLLNYKDYERSQQDFSVSFDNSNSIPDKSFYYNNTNYVLIGHMLFQVDHAAIKDKFQDYEGKNIADLLRYFIFQLCGIEDSFLLTDNWYQNIPWVRGSAAAGPGARLCRMS